MCIKNNKPKVLKSNQSGIYKLNSGACNRFYVGRTHRNLKTRISEH